MAYTIMIDTKYYEDVLPYLIVNYEKDKPLTKFMNNNIIIFGQLLDKAIRIVDMYYELERKGLLPFFTGTSIVEDADSVVEHRLKRIEKIIGKKQIISNIEFSITGRTIWDLDTLVVIFRLRDKDNKLYYYKLDCLENVIRIKKQLVRIQKLYKDFVNSKVLGKKEFLELPLDVKEYCTVRI